MKKIIFISLYLFVFNSFANDKTTNGTWCDEVGDTTSRSQQNYRYLSCKRQIYKLKESPEGADRAGELESMLTSHMTKKGLEFKEAEEVLKSNFFTRGRAFENKKDIASLNEKSEAIQKLADENKKLGVENQKNFDKFKEASEKKRAEIEENIKTNLAKIKKNDEKIKTLATEVKKGFQTVVEGVNEEVRLLQQSIELNARETNTNMRTLQDDFNSRLSELVDKLNSQFCNMVISCDPGQAMDFANDGPNFDFEDIPRRFDESRKPLEAPVINIPVPDESGGEEDVSPQ